jgi:hypothetical protein
MLLTALDRQTRSSYRTVLLAKEQAPNRIYPQDF